MKSPFLPPKDKTLKALMQHVPKDGCMLVFNANNSIRTEAWKANLHCFDCNPLKHRSRNEIEHGPSKYELKATLDLYLCHRNET